MLALIVAGSYIAMEREEWVSAGFRESERDIKEIKRVIARRNFLKDLLTFPQRIVKGNIGNVGRTGIVELEIEGEWAVVGGLPVDRYTCYFYDAGGGLEIFRKVNGNWRATLNRNEQEAWLKEVPDSLVSPQAKELLR